MNVYFQKLTHPYFLKKCILSIAENKSGTFSLSNREFKSLAQILFSIVRQKISVFSIKKFGKTIDSSNN